MKVKKFLNSIQDTASLVISENILSIVSNSKKEEEIIEVMEDPLTCDVEDQMEHNHQPQNNIRAQNTSTSSVSLGSFGENCLETTSESIDQTYRKRKSLDPPEEYNAKKHKLRSNDEADVSDMTDEDSDPRMEQLTKQQSEQLQSLIEKSRITGRNYECCLCKAPLKGKSLIVYHVIHVHILKKKLQLTVNSGESKNAEENVPDQVSSTSLVSYEEMFDALCSSSPKKDNFDPFDKSQNDNDISWLEVENISNPNEPGK